MKIFTVKTLMPCHVTFVYRVEAGDEDEARDLFLNSGAEFVREEVGETISFLDHSGFEVEEGDPKIAPAAGTGIPSAPTAAGEPAKAPHRCVIQSAGEAEDYWSNEFVWVGLE